MKKSEYPRPTVTVDIIILTENDRVLLIKRKNEPFKDHWAIPGGYLNVSETWGEGETLEEAAYRELQEETSLSKDELEDALLCQFKTFSDSKRDPRSRTLSVVFFAILPESEKLLGSVKAAEWFSIHELPSIMAFDHLQILKEYQIFYSQYKKAYWVGIPH